MTASETVGCATVMGLRPMMPIICGTIASLTIESGPGAAAIFGVCEGIWEALNAYCTHLNNLTSGNPGLSGFCQLFKNINISWTDDKVYLLSFLDALPYDIHGTGTYYQYGTGYPNSLEVDSGGDPAINAFKLEPSAPIHGQDYVATAYLSCIPAGTLITMSIVGTDGYTNSQSQTVGTDSPHVDATLWVPGAESGVYDVCTVVVTPPGGPSLTKTASLVFQ